MGCSMYVIIYLLDLKYEFFYLDNDIIQIPLAIVIIGSLACTFLLLVLFMVLNDRTRGIEDFFLNIQKKKNLKLFVSTTIYTSQDSLCFNICCRMFSILGNYFMCSILLRIYYIGIIINRKRLI